MVGDYRDPEIKRRKLSKLVGSVFITLTSDNQCAQWGDPHRASAGEDAADPGQGATREEHEGLDQHAVEAGSSARMASGVKAVGVRV